MGEGRKEGCIMTSLLLSPQARDGESVCVALAGQHGEGRYVVVNLNEGGKVCDSCIFLSPSLTYM